MHQAELQKIEITVNLHEQELAKSKDALSKTNNLIKELEM